MTLTEKQKIFIKMIGESAKKDMQTSHILASITTAQAILESGYGTSELAKKANALFGIKKNGWTGKTYTVKSKEEENGKLVWRTSIFRKYNSYAESIADHSSYLKTRKADGKNLTYKKVVGECNYKKATQALQNAGYSSYSNYANMLCNLIEKYKLTQYDVLTVIPTAVSNKSDRIDVQWLQKRLNVCYKGKLSKLSTDGIWGTKTAEMFKAYLKQVGLPVKNTANKQACNYLKKGIVKKVSSTSTTVSVNTVKPVTSNKKVNKKIALSIGHSILKNGECTSASGVVNEYKYNKKLAPYIKKYLEKVGCTVNIINVPEKKYTSKSSEKTYKLEKINGHKYDMAIELHLNCANGKAHGCEVYYVSSKGKEIAQRIDKKLGTVFTDRGVKTAQLYFLTKTDCPSALVESFFCDSKSDYKIGKNYDKIGKLIAEGIVGVNIN